MASHDGTDVQPRPAVAAAVVDRGRVLMVRRRRPPNAGMLAFPGGRVEPGETLFEAAVRELHEETGIHADAQHILTALDQLEYDAGGHLVSHFVIVVVACRWTAGSAVPGDDASEVHWLEAERVTDEPGLCSSARKLAIGLLAQVDIR